MNYWKEQQEGMLACIEGKTYSDCPYSEDTPHWEAWGASFEKEDLYRHCEGWAVRLCGVSNGIAWSCR